MSDLVDVRSLDQEAARARILEALDEAEEGEVLCIADSIGAALGAVSRAGASDRVVCRTLAAGPAEVLLRLYRVQAPGAVAPSVTGFMTREHARVSALLSVMADAAERDDAASAAVYFTLLSQILRRHIEVEEGLLLPVLSTRHGQPRGPAALLRAEHREILEVLESIEAVVQGGGTPGRAAVMARLLERKLAAHMENEEEIVYRLADRHLDAEERASLIDFCKSSD
jgi:hemerythrin-like domain-containing protein